MQWKRTIEVLCDHRLSIKLNGKFYRTAIRLSMFYGIECWVVEKQHIHKMSVVEMKMLRQLSVNTREYEIQNEEIRLMIGVGPIDENMRESPLKWFDHVQRRAINVSVRKIE